MLAIPVFRSRVAPVLNWCSKVLLFSASTPDGASCEEVALTHIADPYERLRVLQRKGVTTLLCGALSADLLRYAEEMKIMVICGVAGGVSDVLEAYNQHQLDQPRLRLPGCRCRQGFKGTERRSTLPGWVQRGDEEGGTGAWVAGVPAQEETAPVPKEERPCSAKETLPALK
jgi:hypothetical protein